MAGEKAFKLGEAVPIVYQAPNAETGLLDVTAEIVFHENGLTTTMQHLEIRNQRRAVGNNLINL